MKILILDTETTGKIEPEAIEIAFLEINFPSLYVKYEFDSYFKPTKPIELGATAIHHILLEDLKDAPATGTFKLEDINPDYIIGHNIDYDWKVLGEPQVKRICTLALARKYLPELDSHTQSALLYYFLGSKAKEPLRNAHNALADVKICNTILDSLLTILEARYGDVIDIEALHTLSEEARIPETISFGKHKGMKIKELPWDYKNWLLKQPELDPYLKIALTQK